MLRIPTDVCRAIWAKIANDCLARTGDERRVFREINAVIAYPVQNPG
ncbi:hypothetical protein [Acidiphilium sp.]